MYIWNDLSHSAPRMILYGKIIGVEGSKPVMSTALTLADVSAYVNELLSVLTMKLTPYR